MNDTEKQWDVPQRWFCVLFFWIRKEVEFVLVTVVSLVCFQNSYRLGLWKWIWRPEVVLGCVSREPFGEAEKY